MPVLVVPSPSSPRPSVLTAAAFRVTTFACRTPYVQERVDIGPGPPAIKFRLFSQAVKTRYINTVTFDTPGGGGGGAPAPDKPVLVMVHGYGAAQGFFFRNFDALADHFRVHAIDQIGWGGSSRPAFVCKSTEGIIPWQSAPNQLDFVVGGRYALPDALIVVVAGCTETESWFVDSLEDWRKARGIDKFVLLGHSFGGYISARYALKHPERVQRLILVGTAGFAPESDKMMKFRGTFKGQMLSFLWNANTTPQSIIRFLGPLGPRFVLGYTSNRFGEKAQGLKLTDDEAPLFTGTLDSANHEKPPADYMYHTLAGQASGEMCLKHLFSLGAFARRPLIREPDIFLAFTMSNLPCSAHDFKVPTSFIYGTDDWMDYRAGYQAAQRMEVDVNLMRVPQDVNGHPGPTKEAEADVETFRPESPRIHRWGRQVSSSWRFG
eukprot:SM000302S11658  [mRNA]  locus=s302:23754:26337:+ [translate_table: standard]